LKKKDGEIAHQVRAIKENFGKEEGYLAGGSTGLKASTPQKSLS